MKHDPVNATISALAGLIVLILCMILSLNPIIVGAAWIAMMLTVYSVGMWRS